MLHAAVGRLDLFQGLAAGQLDALAKAGVDMPLKVDLELAKYLEGRGEKKLKERAGHRDQGPHGLAGTVLARISHKRSGEPP